MKREESVLPDGWHKRFNEKADFGSSYAELSGHSHSYSEAMRGRIRSYELRCEEADKHFLRAEELSAKEPETVPNLVRQFFLNIYAFDNALIESAVKKGMKLPSLWIPELPAIIAREYPEVRLVISVRKQTDAILRLHAGEPKRAATLFEERLAEEEAALSIRKAFCYLGLAAALHNLDLRSESREHLENAGLTLRATGKTLNRVHVAALLHAFYTYLEDTEEAATWLSFLESLPCPDHTKEVFRRRAKLALARCRTQQCLLMV